MNEQRRKDLEKVIELLEEAGDLIDSAMIEEQDCFDGLGPAGQNTPRGKQMEERISGMEAALELLDELLDAVEDVVM